MLRGRARAGPWSGCSLTHAFAQDRWQGLSRVIAGWRLMADEAGRGCGLRPITVIQLDGHAFPGSRGGLVQELALTGLGWL